MARTKKQVRRVWTKGDERELRAHSHSKTPVARISRAMKRTQGAVRQKAFGMGISLGHQQRR